MDTTLRAQADRAPTLAADLLGAMDRHTGAALRIIRDGVATEVSYSELASRAEAIARGLIALGVEPGDRVGILGATTPEWTQADLGVLAAGATVVPVYHTNSPQECAYVLEHSEARAVLVEDASQAAKIAAVRHELPALEQVIAFTEADGAMPMRELIAAGESTAAEAPARARAALEPDAPATIVYTSGTTGPPKGCLITHANVLAAMDMYEHELSLDGRMVIFMFLPLAHVLARLTQMVCLDVGGTLAFHSGDRETLLDELAELAPTHLPAVPRVFEKIRTRALAKGDTDGIAGEIFRRALATGGRMHAMRESGLRPGALLRAQHALADRAVLSKVRGLFGTRLEVALTGAAPMPPDVLDFFAACGVLILEGYGMSESTAAATLNTPKAYRFGTVGRTLLGSEVRIADDGEVLMRGPHVFAGYHRDPDATAETVEDGWLLSGDLGSVDADGYLRITGRKKDLIITSSGKNVSPSNLESALRESRWISQAVVAGDNQPYLVALLTLDAEEAPALAERLGIPFDLVAMAEDPKVLEVVQGAVDDANRQFARIEQVKRFSVLPRDLSQEEGELTPTMKVKRNVVSARYAAEIEELYLR